MEKVKYQGWNTRTIHKCFNESQETLLRNNILSKIIIDNIKMKKTVDLKIDIKVCLVLLRIIQVGQTIKYDTTL